MPEHSEFMSNVSTLNNIAGNTMNLFFTFIYLLYVCTCVQVRGQLLGDSGALFPSHGTQIGNSGAQTWCQVIFPNEWSYRPRLQATQHGAWTYDFEIKSVLLYWLSYPGVCRSLVFLYLNGRSWFMGHSNSEKAVRPWPQWPLVQPIMERWCVLFLCCSTSSVPMGQWVSRLPVVEYWHGVECNAWIWLSCALN